MSAADWRALGDSNPCYRRERKINLCITVQYLRFLEGNRKTADDASYRYEAFIKDELGGTGVSALTTKTIRDWHAALAKLPPRLRTRKGKAQKHAKLGKDDETKRRRKASANRTMTVLKAALNMAWREGNVAFNAAWARVEPFEAVDAARIRHLSVAEAKRLVNACEPDFRRLVQAALETGARYGELTRLTVADYHRITGVLRSACQRPASPGMSS
jgi:integrase